MDKLNELINRVISKLPGLETKLAQTEKMNKELQDQIEKSVPIDKRSEFLHTYWSDVAITKADVKSRGSKIC